MTFCVASEEEDKDENVLARTRRLCPNPASAYPKHTDVACAFTSFLNLANSDPKTSSLFSNFFTQAAMALSSSSLSASRICLHATAKAMASLKYNLPIFALDNRDKFSSSSSKGYDATAYSSRYGSHALSGIESPILPRASLVLLRCGQVEGDRFSCAFLVSI